MPSERFFYQHPFNITLPIELEDQEFHHLVNVMRARLGDEVEIVNGRGELAKAIIDKITKKSAMLKIISLEYDKGSFQPLILAQALPRLNRLEFIVEKGTELGMTELWLFPAAHSEKKQLTENQQARLQHIAISAMKQCGRLSLPLISFMPPLEKWAHIPSQAFFGDVSPEAPPFSAYSLDRNKPIFFCIGPESGFSWEEVDILQDFGVKGVKLHSHILRVDTAALVALSYITTPL